MYDLILFFGLISISSANASTKQENCKNVKNLGRYIRLLLKKLIRKPLNPSGSAYDISQTPGVKSPLVLNFHPDQDFIATYSVGAEIYFDHDADGQKERTGWIKRSAGLLVLDRNGDGVISNGNVLSNSEVVAF